MKEETVSGSRRLFIILPCMIALGVRGFAQADGWKTAKLDKGQITVQYRISERATESGLKVPMIEDITTTVAGVSLKSCIALMKDPSMHKGFTGDSSSETIEVVSDHEWLVYYFTKNPWPVPDSDCVAVMTFTEDVAQGTAVFTLSAAPDRMENRKVKRMSFYNISYSFKDLGNGSVEIIETGRSSPAVEVPLWLIKSAFPGAPADSIRKFVKIAKMM
jgi:hypothetical protein